MEISLSDSVFSSGSFVALHFTVSLSLSNNFSAVSFSCELRKVKLRSNLPAFVNTSRILVMAFVSSTLNSLLRQLRISPRSPKLISALKILANFSPPSSSRKLYLSAEVVHERLQSRVNSMPLVGCLSDF